MRKSIGALLAIPFLAVGCILVGKSGASCCKAGGPKGACCKEDKACDAKMACCEKDGAAMKCCAPKDGKPCCAEAGKDCACACCKKA